jgi:hypothetical protein
MPIQFNPSHHESSIFINKQGPPWRAVHQFLSILIFCWQIDGFITSAVTLCQVSSTGTRARHNVSFNGFPFSRTLDSVHAAGSPYSQRVWVAEERIVNARHDKKWPRTDWRRRGDDESRQHSKRKMLRREQMGGAYESEARECENEFTASESAKLLPVPTMTTRRAVMISLVRVHLSVLISVASQISSPLASSRVQL